MLADRYSPAFMAEAFLPKTDWHPFPTASDRAAWDKLITCPLQQDRCDRVTAEADSLLGLAWPALPARLFMEFSRNGNRANFESQYFQRRIRLAALVLAECFAGKGKYIEDIVDGLWLITEEATWSLPAHASRLPGDGLPRQDMESVDLFACQTAMLLAEALYLLEDALGKASRALADRIKGEIMRRVIVPVESRDDFWWLSGRNNWSPWCASNTLGAACYLIEDRSRLALLAARLMETVDRFISGYGDDGGCDEGPQYWGVAAGAMLIFLELLYERTGGAVSIYDEPKIRAMGQFILHAHIDGPWFLNFADASARCEPNRPVIYRYGERVGDMDMMKMALLPIFDWQAKGAPLKPWPPAHTGSNLTVRLRELWWMPGNPRPEALPHQRHVWLPDLQVMVERSSAHKHNVLLLAAKGGHNDESHNHNDIGHCILALDGIPHIIDIGVETYTRQTFGPNRYELLAIRGNAHNAPVINGIEQAAGADYRAKEVSCLYLPDKQKTHLSMRLDAAYPPEAGLKRLQRTFSFDGSLPEVVIEDSILCQSAPLEAVLHFYSPFAVATLSPGCLALGSGQRRLLLKFDPQEAKAAVDIQPITDPRLLQSWTEGKLTHICLTYHFTEAEGICRIIFAPEN